MEQEKSDAHSDLLSRFRILSKSLGELRSDATSIQYNNQYGLDIETSFFLISSRKVTIQQEKQNKFDI